MTLRSMLPTTSNRSPEVSVPRSSSGSTPLRSRSPVAFSSTHQTSSSESVSSPPSSESSTRTSWESAAKTACGRGFRTSTGSGPVPSTIIHRTEVSLSVASTPCPSRQPMLHVRGSVPDSEGAVSSIDQMPS